MKLLTKLLIFSVAMGGLFALGGCGLLRYPGQPGVATNGYSKIDLEDLEADGLYVYEISYDNRAEGKGIGAIVTKLYPNAQTYTSNVRTNADGTLYRVKGQYDGAEVQMISIPALNQILLPPNSKITFFIEQYVSSDEVDDRNLAEEKLFKPTETITRAGWDLRMFRWSLLRAAKLLPSGNLAYEITSLDMAEHKFTPSTAILIETNFFQNGIRTNLTPALRAEAVQFLETKFPTGYQGTVKINLKQGAPPISVKIGIHSLKTAEAAGVKVIKNVSEDVIQETLNRLRSQQ